MMYNKFFLNCTLYIDRMKFAFFSVMLPFQSFFLQKFDYNIMDSCNPSCSSFADEVMQEMHLTRSSWTNASVRLSPITATVKQWCNVINCGRFVPLWMSVQITSEKHWDTTWHLHTENFQNFLLFSHKRVCNLIFASWMPFFSKEIPNLIGTNKVSVFPLS